MEIEIMTDDILDRMILVAKVGFVSLVPLVGFVFCFMQKDPIAGFTVLFIYNAVAILSCAAYHYRYELPEFLKSRGMGFIVNIFN